MGQQQKKSKLLSFCSVSNIAFQYNNEKICNYEKQKPSKREREQCNSNV